MLFIHKLQNFRPVPLTVFEIQGFKLKNKNDNNNNDKKKKKKKKKKNWRNRLFAIYPMFVVQFSPVHIHIDLSYHPVVSKVDYH